MAIAEVIGAVRAALTVDEFCSRNRISRVHLYEQWKLGKGPARMQIGRSVRISIEAESEWHRQLEAETAAKVAA